MKLIKGIEQRVNALKYPQLISDELNDNYKGNWKN